MKTQKSLLVLASIISVLLYSEQRAHAQGAVPVHLVITDAALQGNATPPRLDISAVKVKQGKNYLKVTQVVPARDAAATLQFFILIDRCLKIIEGNGFLPLRKTALNVAEQWMLERIGDGCSGLAAIFPAMLNSMIALRCACEDW